MRNCFILEKHFCLLQAMTCVNNCITILFQSNMRRGQLLKKVGHYGESYSRDLTFFRCCEQTNIPGVTKTMFISCSYGYLIGSVWSKINYLIFVDFICCNILD